MKAIVVHQFGGPEVLRLEDAPEPQPGTGEVVVRVRAIGVNPVETYWRAGMNPSVKVPFTPGTDAAGEIESVGPGVAQWKPGARVYTAATLSGAYAEKVLCRASHVHPLPERLSFAQGAAIGVPYATAYRALFQRGAARAGEIVLIHGASGGVGTAATQLARAFGLVVIATVGTVPGAELARENGAHHVVDHTKAGYLEEVRRLTNNRGVPLILEMLSNVNLGNDLPLLAPRGRVVVIGSRGKVEINPRDLMSCDGEVRAMSLFNATDEELASVHTGLYAGFENGTLRPVVREEIPLREAARAHERVLEKGAHGKIVMKPN